MLPDHAYADTAPLGDRWPDVQSILEQALTAFSDNANEGAWTTIAKRVMELAISEHAESQKLGVADV